MNTFKLFYFDCPILSNTLVFVTDEGASGTEQSRIQSDSAAEPGKAGKKKKKEKKEKKSKTKEKKKDKEKKGPWNVNLFTLICSCTVPCHIWEYRIFELEGENFTNW